MRDTELYSVLLGLHSPWFIENVDLDAKAQTVTVHVALAPQSRLACPACSKADCPLYDSRPRKWRHLDTCQFQTFIEASLPRIKCSDCGIKTLSPPWAQPHSRFTLLFERFAIDALREMSISAACRLLRISWDEADTIIARAVERGLLRRCLKDLTRIGVDEKSVGKGQRYITVVTDLARNRVVWAGPDRRMETLDQFFVMLGKEQAKKIECISMDMWRPFQSSCRKWVPDADSKTVLDRFHIEKHLGEALDLVRKQEHRELARKQDERLKGSKWDWLYRPERLKPERLADFEVLRKSDLRTARAYALRENFRHLWSCPGVAEAREYFEKWYNWAAGSGLEPMKKVAKRLRTHLNRILTYVKFKVTNARAEGVNNKIQSLKKKAYGYRNTQRLINAIYFHCADLQLYPEPL